MKLGLKLAILIFVIFLINAAVTIVFTMPDSNPAVALIVIVSTHTATMLAAFLTVRFAVSKPLEKLVESIRNYKSGLKIRKTDRRDEIGELYNSFSSLTNQLDEEKAAQNRIIASISHDIKTPLTSVMGYAEFLKNPNLPEERRRKYINTIYAKALDIQDTVTGFDDYLSHNLDLNLKCEFMTVRELLTSAENDIRTDTVGSGVTVSADPGDCGDEQIYADRSRLRRVFMNAVSNSLRHSEKKDLSITLSAQKSGDDIIIKIRDNGRGVKPDQLEKIFEPLYTTDTSRSVAGLGLSICREIIGSHGGKIWAESEYGKYFSVCFSLAAVNGKRIPD
ncbi:MAG: HAMP domain-containing histidine kinase [Clostridia bacterium]|nr:HAMP domain-containing histidine kinase [Clostridia bacterium]